MASACSLVLIWPRACITPRPSSDRGTKPYPPCRAISPEHYTGPTKKVRGTNLAMVWQRPGGDVCPPLLWTAAIAVLEDVSKAGAAISPDIDVILARGPAIREAIQHRATPTSISSWPPSPALPDQLGRRHCRLRGVAEGQPANGRHPHRPVRQTVIAPADVPWSATSSRISISS